MMRVRLASERKKERAARWSGPSLAPTRATREKNVLNKSTWPEIRVRRKNAVNAEIPSPLGGEGGRSRRRRKGEGT